jgi:hypothetical protein
MQISESPTLNFNKIPKRFMAYLENCTYGLMETNNSDELTSKHQNWLTTFNIRFSYQTPTNYMAKRV